MKSSQPIHLRRRLFLQRWVPLAVFLLGCLLTAAVVSSITSREQADAANAFSASSLAVQRTTQVMFDNVVAVTHSSAALLAASTEINYVEFRAFVSGLQLRQRYPGVDGIGFAPRVERRALASFEKDVALDGFPNFRVRPRGRRADYFPTLLMDPPDGGNRSAIGFDLGSIAVHREAMALAADSNTPAVTPLLGEGSPFRSNRRELVLYLPVYRRGAPITSVAQRRRALVGFVFTRLQTDGVFAYSLAAARSRSLGLTIYDGMKTPDARLVSSGESSGRFESTAPLSVGGRRWLLVTSSREASVAALPEEAKRILAAGCLLSLLLLLLMRAQVRAWQTAERHAIELRAADRAKDEFLAVLSHELRTPLNTVLGWLSMLRGGSVREERRAHALDVIERNARAQAQLIEDLLEVSRIMMGNMRLERRPLTVLPAIASVIDSLRPNADAKGITLRGIDTVTSEMFVIAADAARFAQVITNLVANGIKFTPMGGSVWVDAEAADNAVRISVGDTGIGISPEFLPHVFDRFRQADSSTTRSHSGIGIGLAIARDLVQLHGGRIDAYSSGLNQGSLFVVTLPLIPAYQQGEEAELALAGT